MKNDIVALTKKLISIPSISGGTIEKLVDVLEIAKKPLAGYAFTPFVSNHVPSLLYSNQGSNIRNFKIIFNAHLDVIPADHNSFKPYEKDGKLYGRGAFDMKAAASVMIWVFKEMADKLSFPLGLQLTTDEEVSGMDGTGYQIQQGVRSEFVILGECNSNLRVGNQSKGRRVIKITTKGRASHSAYPWFGENAILRMYEILEPILKAYPVAKEETFATTVNLTRIDSHNEASNKIPDKCTATIDVRYAPQDKDTIIPNIKALLSDDVSMEFEDTRSYHLANPKSWNITTLRRITKDILGKDLPLRFAHATSDAPYFSAVDCDAVEFGPIGHGAHQDDEWVDIQSLEDYYHILKKFLFEIDDKVS